MLPVGMQKKYKLSNQQNSDSWDEGSHTKISGEEHSGQKEQPV